MKVKDLKQKLENYDENLEVLLQTYGWPVELKDVELLKESNDSYVLLNIETSYT